MSRPYDLIVIGTGPGGYVCAIRASQLGMKVAVIEKRKTHGGTCLNVGCIPSKALLHASELFEQASHKFGDMGIEVSPKLDLEKMMAFKVAGVKGNVDGVKYLLKKNHIDTHTGTGRILEPGRVEVSPTDNKSAPTVLETKNIVIATGSDVANLPGINIDEKRVVSSTGALELDEVPNKMIVVGAGVIGLELGSVWRRLGAQVHVVEYLDRILPGMDLKLAKQFHQILKKQGMTFDLSSKVTGLKTDKSGCRLTIEPAGGGEVSRADADVVLIAIGRKPFTDGLGLEEVGITKDKHGRIDVDEHYQTSVPGIYALGDVIKGPMLAHKAEDEGMALAEILDGQAGHVNYDVIPSVIYTYPEVASVGKTQEQLQEAGIPFNIGKFPFTANGRAKVNGTTEGFIKVLAHKETDTILGIHMIGPNVSEIIAEAAVIMEFGGSAEDLARICHAHPTLSEAVKEAALAVANRAIHM